MEVSSGNKKSTCDFTIVLKDEKIDEESTEIKCSPQKKKMTVGIVLTSKTMKIFSLNFTLKKSKINVLSSSVETGSYSFLTRMYLCAKFLLSSLSAWLYQSL